MFSLDPYILDFVGGNWLAIGLLIILLDGLSEIIKGDVDNRIVGIFKRMVSFTRRQQPKQ